MAERAQNLSIALNGLLSLFNFLLAWRRERGVLGTLAYKLLYSFGVSNRFRHEMVSFIGNRLLFNSPLLLL